MDIRSHEEAIELLDATHDFPCEFMFKVIGPADEAFIGRIISAVRVALKSEEDPPFRTKQTPSGRHIAITLEPVVPSAHAALDVYACIREVEGVVLVM